MAENEKTTDPIGGQRGVVQQHWKLKEKTWKTTFNLTVLRPNRMAKRHKHSEAFIEKPHPNKASIHFIHLRDPNGDIRPIYLATTQNRHLVLRGVSVMLWVGNMQLRGQGNERLELSERERLRELSSTEH